jgi:hypothetical protein
MSDHEPAEELRVVVWTRDPSPPPGDPRRDVLSRLREVESTGVVDDVSVQVWSKHVSAPADDADESSLRVRRRVAEFVQWADRNGHSLEPAFRWCERSSMVSEERTAVIRLPLLCLAVHEGGRLVGVFPCSTEGGTNTVADCLDRLETGDVTDEPSAEHLE